MKKFLTIITTTITVWAILTYIISNQTQKEFQNYIDKSKNLYASNGLKLTLSNYQQSFLLSKATVEIDFIEPEIAQELKKEYILPIKIKYDIEHGPIFFKDKFGVGLSKMSNRMFISSLLQPKAKEEFLEFVKDDINLKTDMVVSFSKKLEYRVESDEVNINRDKRDFYMTPLTFMGKTHIETLEGDGKLLVSNIKLKEESSDNGVEVKNLAIDIKLDEFIEDNIVFGDFKFSIEDLLIKDSQNSNIETINIAINGAIENQRESQTTMNSNFKGYIDFKDTKLPSEFKELQNINLAMNISNIGIKGISEFQQIVKMAKEEQETLLEQLPITTSENIEPIFIKFHEIEDEMISNLIESLNSLLIKNKTAIKYTLNIDTKDKESTKALVEVGYTGDIEFKGRVEDIITKIQSKLLSIIRLNMDIELNKKHLALIPVPMLEQQIQMGVTQGFIKDNNSSYSLNGYYRDKELMINDNNLTSTILPLIMIIATL